MATPVSPLDAELKRYGAHMAEREGWLMAADFGSLSAEIAVSSGAAGLTDVSSLGKFEVRGSALAIADVHPSGRMLTPGRGLETADAWWCVITSELLVVLSRPSATERVRADLKGRVAVGEVELTEVTAERVAVCLTGPAARDVVTHAGIGDDRVGTARLESVHGVPTIVLHKREQQWLLVAPASDASALWHALSEDGAPFGLAYVGADALQHLHAAARR
jgi:glycine cleavage system aminomethyltransferase T